MIKRLKLVLKISSYLLSLSMILSCANNSDDEDNPLEDISTVRAIIEGTPTLFDNVTYIPTGTNNYPKVIAEPLKDIESNQFSFTMVTNDSGVTYLVARLYHDDGLFNLNNGLSAEISVFDSRKLEGTFNGSLTRYDGETIDIQEGEFEIFLD